MSIGDGQREQVVKRLHYVKGQLEGIERMFSDDRASADIYAQLKAVEGGVHEAIHTVFDGHKKQHFAEVLAQLLALWPGDCEDGERLRFLMAEFGKFELKELIDEFANLRNSLNSVAPVKLNLPKGVKKAWGKCCSWR